MKKRTKDTRPFIVQANTMLASPVETATAGIVLVLVALVTGFIIGLAVFAVMNASVWLTELVWDGADGRVDPPWFSLVVCLVGGIAVGLWTQVSQNRIDGLEEVLGEFRATGSYRLDHPGKTVISFLLPLVFGGSVGFEAGLTGLVAAGCCWIRDKLKALGLRGTHIADVTIAACLSAMFGAPLAGIVAGAESMPASEDDADAEGTPDPPRENEGPSNYNERLPRDSNGIPVPESGQVKDLNVDDFNMRRGAKLVLYMSAAIGAFAGIHLFSGLFGVAAGLPRFEAIQAQGAEYLWILPCLAAGYVLALLYHGSNHLFGRLADRLDETGYGTVAKPIVAGLALGAVGMVLPFVLFPGESQSHFIMNTWQTWTVAALLATALLKAVATPLCIRMGWIGGMFFPCIFSGVACGYGLAMLTGADPMLMVTATASAFLAGATRKPLLSVAILALCFPLTGILFSGLAAVVGGALPIPPAWQDGPKAPAAARRKALSPKKQSHTPVLPEE